jgi:hypothetical protein
VTKNGSVTPDSMFRAKINGRVFSQQPCDMEKMQGVFSDHVIMKKRAEQVFIGHVVRRCDKNTVKPVLNGISRVQNIFPLKPGFRLIKVYYDSHGT